MLAGSGKTKSLQDLSFLWYYFGRTPARIVSDVKTVVVCPVAAEFVLLKEFSSQAHCDCMHCRMLLKLVSQMICNFMMTAPTLTELVTSSL